MKNTVAFVLSEGYSGSTWLAYVLGAHSEAACLGEYYLPFQDRTAAPCNYCASKGLPDCAAIPGLRDCAVNDAFAHAFNCLKRPLLIDNSKKLSWLENFLDASDFHLKFIHLIREPRGWFASARRRRPMTDAQGIERWLKNNRAIEQFSAEQKQNRRIENIQVSYDQLVLEPSAHFPRLCDFLKIQFDKSALEYWKLPQHGPAGNGAAFNVIGDIEKVRSGDADFYQKNKGQNFYDTRWRDQLSAEEIRQFEGHPDIREYLAKLSVPYP